jgi:DNA invertase Pin-like site-specific DNA recombinase
MLVGYARVSTHEQNLDMQLDALKQAGCQKIFTDKISTLKAERKGLDEALTFLRPGDVLVVWKLDRLGRTLKQLIELVALFNQKGIGFKSLKETIDTTTSTGKLVFHIFAALAEFERDIIHERTRAGLEAARARGRLGGRPKLQKTDPKKIALARKLYSDQNMPVQEICETLHIERATLYRYVVKKTDKVGQGGSGE